MRNLVLKVLAGLCIVLFILVIFEAIVIKNKSEELRNNIDVISAQKATIVRLESVKKEFKTKIEEEQKSKKEQETKMHPLYKAHKACMEGKAAIKDMIHCAIVFEKGWSGEIQNNLTMLEKMLNEEQYTLLLEEQKAWEGYATLHKKLLFDTVGKMDGTFYFVTSYQKGSDIQEERALELEHIIKLLSSEF